jgi:nucleotide-binding universal stress UspA family protein
MNIMIATDGKSISTHAVREAIRLLPLSTSNVFVVSVMDPEQRIGGNENAAQDVEEALAMLTAAGVTAEGIVLRGTPSAEIVRTATEKDADIIVVGAVQRGAVARFLLGRTAQNLIETWHKSVFIVRA